MKKKRPRGRQLTSTSHWRLGSCKRTGNIELRDPLQEEEGNGGWKEGKAGGSRKL